jgi:hypothetical protein
MPESVEPRGPSQPARLVARFLSLTPDQQEFFMALLPNWHFTVDELIDASIYLSA